MEKVDTVVLVLVIPPLETHFTMCFFSSTGREVAALSAPRALGWSQSPGEYLHLWVPNEGAGHPYRVDGWREAPSQGVQSTRSSSFPRYLS